MTVSSSTYKSGPYNGDASTTVFTVGFYFLANSDLLVTRRNADGSDTTLVITSDYTVSGAGNPAGGSITCLVAPATGTKITISRNMVITQQQSYPNSGTLPAQTIEQGLDRLTMIAQQISGYLVRTLQLSVSSLFSGLTISDPIANNLVGWDATATKLESKGVATNALNVTTFFAAGNVSPTIAPSATGLDALAVGNSAVSNGTRALAMGKAYASGTDSVCIQAGNSSGTYGAKANNSTVIGGTGSLVDTASIFSSIFGGIGNYIGDTAGGTNTIVGGQGCDISGAATFRSAILGGDNNQIHGATGSGRAAIVGGGFNEIRDSSYSTILGSSSSTIISSGTCAVVGAQSATFDTGSDRSGIIGGYGHYSKGTSNGIMGGQSATIIGGYSGVIGGTSAFIQASYSGICGGNFSSITANYSGTVGGSGNTISGTGYSGIVGGFSHNTSNAYTGIVGGRLATINADYGGIVGGDLNQVSGNYGGIIGGRFNLVDTGGVYGSACGLNATSRLQAQAAQASGVFAATGDAQTSVLVSRNVTSNGTQTEIYLDGATATKRLVLSNDTTWMFDILITARRTDADNESAAYRLVGCIDRNANAASTALVGSVTKTVIAEDTAAWDVDAQADTTNGALVIKVTGEAAKTIRWVARVALVEVTG